MDAQTIRQLTEAVSDLNHAVNYIEYCSRTHNVSAMHRCMAAKGKLERILSHAGDSPQGVRQCGGVILAGMEVDRGE